MGFFDFLLRRERRVQVLLEEYMDIWIACFRSFQDAWDVYLRHGLGEEFFYRVDATHKEESRADDMRRKIEHELYSKALLPESRGDILGILETVDHLLTYAERSLYEIQVQEIIIPQEIRAGIEKMVELTSNCADAINRATRALLVSGVHAHSIRDLVQLIDQVESETDHLERSLVRTLFRMSIDTGQKLLLKNLIRQLSKVTDEAENVGDRLTLVGVKRRV
ncbi:MAG: DUF47 family protein [Planctomycetota bacterium]